MISRLWSIAILALLAGCASGKSNGGGGGGSGGNQSASGGDGGSGQAGGGGGGQAGGGGSQASTGACDLAALGLGAARKVAPWNPPATCKPTDPGGPAAGTVRTEQELAARFTCDAGATAGIDFGKHELVIQDRTLSPAGVGGEVVDDGKTVTYVSHQRHTCPDEPRPMPMNQKVMFLLPANSPRQFAEATCTVGPKPDCR